MTVVLDLIGAVNPDVCWNLRKEEKMNDSFKTGPTVTELPDFLGAKVPCDLMGIPTKTDVFTDREVLNALFIAVARLHVAVTGTTFVQNIATEQGTIAVQYSGGISPPA